MTFFQATPTGSQWNCVLSVQYWHIIFHHDKFLHGHYCAYIFIHLRRERKYNLSFQWFVHSIVKEETDAVLSEQTIYLFKIEKFHFQTIGKDFIDSQRDQLVKRSIKSLSKTHWIFTVDKNIINRSHFSSSKEHHKHIALSSFLLI